MKYLITLLSFFTLSFGEDASSFRVFSDVEITQWRLSLSSENLTTAFNNEELSSFPLDRIQPIYDETLAEIQSRLESVESNENGFKLNSQKDKELLIFIIEETRAYSRNFDPGNAHFRSFSQLYHAAEKDMSLAIERANLSAYDKKIVRANIR